MACWAKLVWTVNKHSAAVSSIRIGLFIVSDVEFIK